MIERRQLLSLTAVAATMFTAACGSPAPDPPPRLSEVARSDEPRRIDVLFLGHADSTHDARGYAPILAAALGNAGININYTEATADLDAAALALFDAVIVYAHPDGNAPGMHAALQEYVAGGGGFVSIHDAADADGGADSFVQLVDADPGSHGVLASHGAGRTFHTAYGHYRAAWEQPLFQQLIQNAVLWAVGDDVRALREAYAVPPLRYSDPPVLIPNYENRPEPLKLQEPLSPEESLKHWQVPPGFELQLFAAEPEIVNPIAMAFDERGRLWVVETLDYPNNIQPDGEGNDRILILEDTDGDGRADRSTVFADGLSIPTGIVFARGGVIVSNAPRFLFLQDTDGDDRADVREVIMTGWSVADTHSGASNLVYGFDNWIWGAVGDAGYDGEVGGRRQRFAAGIYRFRPDGSELELIARYSNNTWGIGFTEGNDVFNSTANNEHSVFVAIPDRYYAGVTGLRGTGKARIDGHYARHPITPNTRQVDYFGGFTAAGGHNFYTARSFPREYWNRVALIHEAIGGLVHRAIIERAGSGFRESDGWNLVASADEWAAPVQAEVGPDGAVWFLDWYSFIKQHNPTPPGFATGAGAAYETPLRDRSRGRIYRLVWKGAPAYEPMALSVDRPDQLVDALRHHNMFWRMTAQRLLVQRGNTDVLADLFGIIGDRSVDQIGSNAPAVHAIWTLHGLGVLDGSNTRAARAVRDALEHPAASVRKNAVMALPRNAQTFTHFERAGVLTDDDLNVRLHALLAIAELPPADDIGRALFTLSQDAAVLDDEWLPTALFLAARRHDAGFLDAFVEELGALDFARLLGRAARGELDQVVDWSGVAVEDAAWDTVRVPAHWTTTELAHFAGAVWFRHAFDLPASLAGRTATLTLGPISDGDVTYVNGVRVGAMDNVPGEPREYPVPAGVLRAGRNVVAVEVTNQRRGGGIYGSPDVVALVGAEFRIPLAGSWKYRKGAEWRGGRQPDFTPGIPFAQQFLRYHNPAGVLAGGAAGVASGAGAVPGTGAGVEPAAAPDVTVALGTVPGQNRYDRDVITVRAGQRIAVAFDNTDGMLHNVVVLGRGSDRDEVGALLNAYVSDASASGRDFIPPRLPVLAQSGMVSPREAETFVFTAPTESGDYLFLCTVPGHWLTMWGTLRVTP